MSSSTIALIILGITLILYITEILPLPVTSILACIAFSLFGIIPVGRAFGGFGNHIVYLIVGMIIVGNTLFETGVAQLMGRKIISAVGTKEKVFICALVLVSTIISSFLNNTATVAIMLPIATAAINASGGKLLKKNTFMMVGIVAVVGGGLTLVGSTPQLIGQGVLEAGGHELIGFFEISKIGLPVLAVTIIYFLTIGNKLQKKVFNFPEVIDDKFNVESDDANAESKKSPVKMFISVIILIFCIVAFITEEYVPFWNVGMIAMIGASMCIITGCITQKRVFETMDWTTVVILGCSFGLGAGLYESGAGALIAQTAVNLLGDNVTPFLLCAALALVAMILTNFMSSTATAALLAPISASVAIGLGFNVKSVVMATVIATNLGFATPVSTPPLTMTLAGGYRFKDYLIVGGLLNILIYITVIILFPIVFTF